MGAPPVGNDLMPLRSAFSHVTVGGLGAEHFTYTKNGNDIIAGISDADEWNLLIEAFRGMGFSSLGQKNY